MYIFEENEENNITQDNVVQTQGQSNKSKPKENIEKEKNKSSEQKRIVNTP
jgi:hypothetical protein